MALPSGPSPDSDELSLAVEINTTPLIDVMLVLLIMLIVTIPVGTHMVNLALPDATPPKIQTPPPVDTLIIDADGALTWNGVKLDGEAALEARLSAVAAATSQDEVHIHPDPRSGYKYLASALADAQRLGVTDLAVVDDAP